MGIEFFNEFLLSKKSIDCMTSHVLQIYNEFFYDPIPMESVLNLTEWISIDSLINQEKLKKDIDASRYACPFNQKIYKTNFFS